MSCKGLRDLLVPAYWSMDTSRIAIKLIGDEDSLDDCWSDIADSCFCALDAEWKPDSSRPRATLVQLACRTHTGRGCVYLLDLVCLNGQRVRKLLQLVFRRAGTVKVGFAMEGDLLAIATALGHEGGGCVAKVTPQVDISMVYKHLLRSRVQGLPSRTGNSLSGLVAAVLGKPLDKSEQCSAWHERPLSPAQILYAANDAQVLLALLDAFMAAAAPHGHPMRKRRADEEASVPAENTCSAAAVTADCDTESEAPADPRGAAEPVCSGCMAGADGSCHTSRTEAGRGAAGGIGDGALPGGCAHSAVGWESPARSRPPGRGAGSACGRLAHGGVAACVAHPLLDLQPDGLIAGFLQHGDQCNIAVSVQQCAKEVASAWGFTLVYEAGRFSRPESIKVKNPMQGKHAEGDEEGDEGIGWPEYIPWEHGSAQRNRFVCDTMLEGLARQLRLFGVDAASTQQRDKRQRALAIRNMIEVGTAEQRVVLTGDKYVVRQRYAEQCYLVRAKKKKDQLSEVVRAFGIELDVSQLMSRCTFCNGEFFERAMTQAELPEESAVPAGVKMLHDEFWVCKGCKKVFWQGEQYSNAIDTLSMRVGAMSHDGQ